MIRATLASLVTVSVPWSSAGAAERIITDCRGRKIGLRDTRRIACIGGTITETLYALGAAERIIAVDTTSTWPQDALRDKKSLGYMRMISSEGVLSMRPDLILAMNDSGPPAAMDQIVASGTPVIFVDATPSPEAIIGRTRFLATLLGTMAKGDALCQTIDDRFRALADWRAAHPLTRRVLFVMRMTGGHALAAGSGTAADAVIRLAGALNAGHAMQGYKIVEDEALIGLRPDIVLTMSQDTEAIRAAMLADPGFRLTPAGRNRAIIAMEGERLLGFGPRTPQAALDLAQMIASQPT
ncbi:periplasmic binding protein [Gluconobacter kanchanaburiensis NBRC 103587]|nr:periplasmic binding protein [Gluconobacter kanchanaburiensis NBRC 103587]